MGKHSRRTTETSDYAAMLERMIRAWGDRIADDPVALAHTKHLAQVLTDATNAGIFAAKNKAHQPYSLADMAKMMGVSYQAVQQRAGRGEQVVVDAAARRADGALVRIGDVRRARAEGLAAAGLDDRTGSDRERAIMPATGTDGARR